MICKQYKAKGPVTNTLLPVVAMDDAVALVAFGLSMAVIKVIDSGQFSIKAVSMPLLEIVEALALGFVLGLVLTQLVKFYTGRGNRLARQSHLYSSVAVYVHSWDFLPCLPA